MYKVNLTQQEVEIIARGLLELPAKLSYQVLQKLEDTVNETNKTITKESQPKETSDVTSELEKA